MSAPTMTGAAPAGLGANTDLYALLGVLPDAQPDAIRRAYGDKVRDAMDDLPRFETLNAAYEILKDPEKRAAYDRERAGQPKEKTRMTAAAEPPPAAPPPPASDATVAMPSSGSTVMGGGSTMMGGRTVAATPTMMGFGGERTQAVNLPPCPICGTPGVPGEEFCVECGFLTGSVAGEEVVNRPLPRLVDTGGREFPLKLGENIVGREGADVILPDKTVSRRHAKIVVEENGVAWIEDLGSTNGTRLNSASLPAGKQSSLSDRAAVQFGSIKMTLLLPEGFVQALKALPAPEPSSEKPAVASLPAAGVEAPEEAAGRLIGAGGKVFSLASERTTLGRRAGNSIIISDDAFVSGNHAVIAYENGGFQVMDLGSTNGTKLNGRKLLPNAPQPLADGDEVTLGQTAFTFRAPAAAASGGAAAATG